jgi:hypothetical protein
VRIASRDELTRAAQEAAVMGHLRRFVEWVGEGRRLTGSARLRLHDVPELIEALGLDPLPAGLRLRSSSDVPRLRWIHALATEGLLVEVAGCKLVATDLGRAIADRPLDAWQSVFEGLLDTGITSWFRGRKAYLWRRTLHVLPSLLLLAYLEGSKGLPVEDLAGPASDPLVVVLAELGVARPPSLVLTPLGVEAVHALLTSEGYRAPSVDYGPGDDPATLLRYWASLEPDHELPSEVDAWLALRTPGAAVPFLAEPARTDTVARSLFFYVLQRLGPEAAASVSLLQHDPTLCHYATAWLVDRGLAEAEALADDDLHWMMADRLAGVLIGAGPEAMIAALGKVGSPGQQIAVVEALGTTGSLEAARILQALAATHPDPAVSRAARKGQFRGLHLPGNRARGTGLRRGPRPPGCRPR